MNCCFKRNSTTLLAMCVVGLLLCSCTNDEKPKSSSSGVKETHTESVTPGAAGGVFEDTYTVSATVTAIDKNSRKISLTGSDGSKGSLTAPAEMKNFDQLKVGDNVTATVAERLVIFVRSGDTEPSITHASALAAAPKGAKPGALAIESFEVIATVKAIDTVNRTATLQFVDGSTKTYPVRADVELSRYKVGDSVVIRVTAALKVIATKPA